MSRRRAAPDPVVRTAGGRVDHQTFQRSVQDALATLGRTAAEIVYSRWWDGVGFSEIAPELGISESRCRQIYYEAMNKLRQQPWRSEALRPYMHHDFARVVADLEDERIASWDYKPEDEPMLWCRRHNCRAGIGSWARCAACPCRFETHDPGRARPRGRPRVYCSEACRQAAHRQRRKDKTMRSEQ